MTYFSGVATIANLWRGTGAPRKILDAARTMTDERIADMFSRKIPGRCLRGRLLSVDSVGSKISGAARWIGLVFSAVFAASTAGRRYRRIPAKRTTLEGPEDRKWQEDQSRYKSNGKACCNSEMFLSAVKISKAAKGPLTHFMLWLQKAVKVHNDAKQDTTHNKILNFIGGANSHDLKRTF